MTNNPFALPTVESVGASRFPAIDTSQFNYGQPGPSTQQQQYSGGYGGQQQGLHGQLQPEQPQQFGMLYAQPSGFQQQQPQPQPLMPSSSTGAFQPQSSFGQYLQSQGSSVNFGVPQSSQYSGAMAHQQGSSVFYSSQPQMLNNQHVADLDPYSSRYGQSQPPPQQQMQAQQYSYSQPSPSPQPPIQPQQQAQTAPQDPNYGEHPRHFMRANASVLETWEKTAWARVRALLNQLEKAWESRKKLVMDWQTWNLSVDDRDQVDKLRKEADSNIDTVAAYVLQVKEVFENYRHSSDQYSRNQVRQAMNSGLQSLPDWPSAITPPPKLSEDQPGRTSLFDSGPPQQQFQQQQQHQQQQMPYHQQQQQQIYGQQQTGLTQQQPQQQYGYAPQSVGNMYGQQTQQQGMYRPW